MFPISHLCSADRLLDLHPMRDDDAAAFLLGAIAPDGVHYRQGFTGADKLVSHICPRNGQRWGRVTDNERWVKCVTDYLDGHGRSPFLLGYATHILSDICNNIRIWQPLCRDFPAVADQGYGSRYYDEWNNCDAKLYQSLPENSRIKRLLPQTEGLSVVKGVDGLVTEKEVNALRDNILYESYPNKPAASVEGHIYFTYEALLDVVEESARLSYENLFTETPS